MRPISTSFLSPVEAVTAHDTGYAVLTADGITLLAPDLTHGVTIPGSAPRTDSLARLADGRWLAFSSHGFTYLYAGAPGGTLAAVWPPELFSDRPAVTASGFVANYDGRLYIDDAGQGRWVAHGAKGRTEAVAKDRIVLSGERGLVVIDLEGRLVAHRAEPAHPKVLGVALGHVVVNAGVSVELLDLETLALVRAVPTGAMNVGLVADGDLVAQVGSTATRWDLASGTKRWEHTAAHGRLVAVVGERVVLHAREPDTALILDRAGGLADEVALDASLWRADAMGDGCALATRGATIVWWRGPDRQRSLAHDLHAERVAAVPAGLLTAESRMLHLWRADDTSLDDDDGAGATLETAIPLDAWIVTDGRLMKPTALGRFRVLAEVRGERTAIDPGAAFRRATGPGEARVILDGLLARDTSGVLPEIAEGELPAQLAQRPQSATAALQARALFAADTLDPRTLALAARSRQAFFRELALALGVPWRPLLAGVRAGRVPFTPPREIASAYEYLGAFESAGKLSVADPCHFALARAERSRFLSVELAAEKGTYHLFARNGTGTHADRTGELVAIHETGFLANAVEEAGSIAVDAGLAGVFDSRCPKLDLQVDPFEEGIHHGLSGVTHSGVGDGGYAVYVARIAGKVVKVRIAFLEDAEGRDRAVVAPPRGGRKYAPSERFAAGDSLEHPKFGAGLVTRINSDGKIDVTFADGPRSLVHARPPK